MDDFLCTTSCFIETSEVMEGLQTPRRMKNLAAQHLHLLLASNLSLAQRWPPSYHNHCRPGSRYIYAAKKTFCTKYEHIHPLKSYHNILLCCARSSSPNLSSLVLVTRQWAWSNKSGDFDGGLCLCGHQASNASSNRSRRRRPLRPLHRAHATNPFHSHSSPRRAPP